MSSIKSNADSLTKTFSNLAKKIALAFSISKFVSFSMDAAKYATQTEASVQRLIDIYGIRYPPRPAPPSALIEPSLIFRRMV